MRLLLGFICFGGHTEKWYFAKRDARVFELAPDWEPADFR